MDKNNLLITDHLEHVLAAKSFFKHDSQNSLYLAHDFINLATDLHAERRNMHKEFQYISQDIWNIGAILSRLEWTQLMLQRKELNDGQWSYFAALDIDHFHIQIKSTMDHVAEIIRLNAVQPGVIPENSFRKLENWMYRKPANRDKLGAEFVKIVESCRWLPDYRQIRDSLVHQGGYTLVFTDPNKILFQTYGPAFDKTIEAIGLMHNKHIVDFEKYAVLAFSRLLVTLADLATIVRHKSGAKRFGIGDNKMTGYGFSTYIKWADDFLRSKPI